MLPIELAKLALAEDVTEHDVTTQAVRDLFLRQRKQMPQKSFTIFAKASGVFCGRSWVRALAEAAELNLQAELDDGETIAAGQVVCSGVAAADHILRIERTLLNELQHLCGIATLTRAFVDEVQLRWRQLRLANRPAPGVFHTRKTLALHRDLQIEAVLAGGGQKHRRDLGERVLMKENHKYLMREQGLELPAYFSLLAEQGLLANALIEVENLNEAVLAESSGVRHLLLDNFSPEAVREALRKLSPVTEIEISGGLSLESIANFVMPGVSRLSVGALTHSVRALDLSLDWKNT